MIQRTKVSGLTLEIEESPAGYSEGTWGYYVRDDAGNGLGDGGYASRQHATEAGTARANLLARVLRISIEEVAN